MLKSDTQEFKKADNLRIELEKDLGTGKDVLSLYRTWLDRNEILAENKNGYPSEDAYDEKNIERFLLTIKN